MATYINVDDVVYSEADGQAVFTVLVSGDAVTADIVIDYDTLDATALDVSDYDTTVGQLIIPAGTIPFLKPGIFAVLLYSFSFLSNAG